MSALEEAPDRYEVPQEEEQRERFIITDDDQAVWAMRKLRDANAKVTELERIAKAEIERVQAWLETATRDHKSNAAFFEHLLIRYGMQQREEQGRKSVTTPYGKVQSRQTPDKYEVAEDDFIGWAQHHRPDLLKVKTTVSMSDIRSALALTDNGETVDLSTGEVVPFVTVTPGGVSYSVSTSN